MNFLLQTDRQHKGKEAFLFFSVNVHKPDCAVLILSQPYYAKSEFDCILHCLKLTDCEEFHSLPDFLFFVYRHHPLPWNLVSPGFLTRNLFLFT